MTQTRARTLTIAEGRALLAQQGKKRNKYRAKRTTVDGITFDSKREAARFEELKLFVRAGVIKALKRQEPFEVTINGVHCFTWNSDFSYTRTATGERVIEDAKGVRTPVYRLKKRIIEAAFQITIREV